MRQYQALSNQSIPSITEIQPDVIQKNTFQQSTLLNEIEIDDSKDNQSLISRENKENRDMNGDVVEGDVVDGDDDHDDSEINENTQFLNFDSFIPTISVEELMKRRSIEFAKEQNEFEEEIVGPTYFPMNDFQMPLVTAEELLKRRFQVSNDNEYETHLDFVASKPKDEIFIEPKPEETKKSNLLFLLGDYGDDDDEEEIEEENEIKEENIGSTDFSIPIQKSETLKVESSVAPKPMKVDKSLTQFMPTSVRVKRNNLVGTTSRPTKIQKFDNTINEPFVITKNEQIATNDKEDDAYAQFFAEIDALESI